MRHKYMKSLLLTAVALLGFSIPSFAQDANSKCIVQFITTETVDLSTQDIKLGFSPQDLKTIAPKADGTYELTPDANFGFIHRIYFSVNGFGGGADYYDAKEEWNDDYTSGTVTTYYKINLYKFRFNYSGTNISNVSLKQSSGYSYGEEGTSVLLAVNKDYYLPAGQYAYDNGSFSLSKDTTIDLPTMYSLTVKTNVAEAAKSSLYITVQYYDETYGSWRTSVTTERGVTELNTAVKEGKYRVILEQQSGSTLDTKEIQVSSDQMVTFNLSTLSVKVNASEETKQSLRLELSYYDETYQNWRSLTSTDWGVVDCDIAVKAGKYRVNLIEKSNEDSSGATIGTKVITVTSNQTVTFDLLTLSVNVNAPEEIKNSLIISLSRYEGNSYYSSSLTSGLGVTKWDIALTEGKYRITLNQIKGSYNTIGSKEIELTSDQAVTFDVSTITVKVVEPDGTPLEGVNVYSSINNSGSLNGTTDVNGYCSLIATDESEIRIHCSDSYMSSAVQLFTLAGNKTITVTFPKIIAFKVMLNGEPYSIPSGYGIYLGDEDNTHVCEQIGNGLFQTRVDPESRYRLRLYDDDHKVYTTANSIRISKDMTIRVGRFATKADGVGLDFFMGDGSYLNFDTEYGWSAVIIGGTPVRIAAVPVGNEQFVCWDVNEKEYNSPMIDFTPKDDYTVATAKFTGEISNQVKGIAGQGSESINVTIEGGYLVLPADVEAEAAIYATDGRLTKKTGVVGSRIYINNLPDGAYVLVLTVDGRRQAATFVKQ